MPFKKIKPEVVEALEQQDIVDPTPFQKAVLPKVRSGVNAFCIGEKGCGKTMALIIATLHKLEFKAKGDAPRAIILVETKAQALALKATFECFTRRSDLRIYAAYEEQTLDQQREEVYYGQDVLIVTPRRLNKLYLMNSLDLSQLKLYVLEDAEFAENGKYIAEINRIPESISKCQYLVFAKTLSPRLQRLEASFMDRSHVVKA